MRLKNYRKNPRFFVAFQKSMLSFVRKNLPLTECIGIRQNNKRIQTKKVHIMETALFGRVNSTLRKIPYFDPDKVTFVAREGNVVLRGEVPSFFAKQMAQESLKLVEGVFKIDNELEVMGRPICLVETK